MSADDSAAVADDKQSANAVSSGFARLETGHDEGVNEIMEDGGIKPQFHFSVFKKAARSARSCGVSAN